MAVDHFAVYTIPFLVFTIISFIAVFCLQLKRLDNELNRLIILTTRLALFLPFYGIVIYISLMVPVLYSALSILTAVIEGYSFYCFFVLLVTNLGGPQETVSYLNQSNKPLLMHCCCPPYKAKFYEQATRNMYHFLFTRVVIVALSVMCSYIATAKDSRAAKALSVLLSLIALILLIRGVCSVVNLYEDLYAHLKNINGVLKVFLLKLSVALITIEGIIESFLSEYGGNPFKEKNGYTAQERLQRSYCALVLAEFTVLAIVYLYAFGSALQAPSTPYNKYVVAKGRLGYKIKPTVGWFLCEVFSFRDVFGVLKLEQQSVEEPPSSTELKETNKTNS